MYAFLCLLSTFLLTACNPAWAAANTANIVNVNTASTNVTTGAYVTLTGTSGAPLHTSRLIVINSTTSVLKIAFGPAGSEVDQFAVPPSSSQQVQLGVPIVIGTRVSVEAISGTASTGYVSVSFLL